MSATALPAAQAARRLTAARWLRVVNFHHTPRALAAGYERQVEALRGYAPVDEDDVEALVAGRASSGPPACVPMLFEGFRNAYDVLLPMIEAVGLRAWLFIPTRLLDTPPDEQVAFALAHMFELPTDRGGPGDDYDDPRLVMTWDEVRDCVRRGHTVACHTATHADQAYLATAQDVEREVVAPKRRLEEELGVDVRTIAFLWGTPAGLRPHVDAGLRDAGYRLVVSATMVQRI